MKKYVALGILVVMTLSTALDAAPRSRRKKSRRGRRARSTARTTTNYQTTPVVRSDATSTTPSTATLATPATPPAPGELQVGDALPVLDGPLPVVPASASASDAVKAEPAVVKRSGEATAAAKVNAALAELNALRAQRGLHAFKEDPALTKVALHKAQIQASRGWVGHPGGTMGGARYEGVGMGSQFITCYRYANFGTYAGAATVQSSNGRKYHCLLIR